MLDKIKKSCLFRITHTLAIFWSVVSAGFIFMITFGHIPEANVRFADTILGFMLGTVVSTIIGYYMGSNHGQQVKDELNAPTE
jgi:ABC-type nitrate/sulfonate/bicarbonate transport system permease component